MLDSEWPYRESLEDGHARHGTNLPGEVRLGGFGIQLDSDWVGNFVIGGSLISLPGPARPLAVLVVGCHSRVKVAETEHRTTGPARQKPHREFGIRLSAPSW